MTLWRNLHFDRSELITHFHLFIRVEVDKVRLSGSYCIRYLSDNDCAGIWRRRKSDAVLCKREEYDDGAVGNDAERTY